MEHWFKINDYQIIMKAEKESTVTLNVIELINPDKTPLDIDKLKTFEGMENLSENELSELLFSIQNFCALVYDYYTSTDSQDASVIPLNSENLNKLKIVA